MHKLAASLIKEFLILVRDIPGLLILFIMPVMLIVIVTVAQQNAQKTSKESKTDLLFIDKAQSAFSGTLIKTLDSSGLYTLIKEYENLPLDEPAARKLIADGEYAIGLIIAEKDSAIRLLIDPALQETYKNSMVGSLTFFIKGTQSRMAIEGLLKQSAPGMDAIVNKMIRNSLERMPAVTVIYGAREETTIKPSLSQNIIPGFILFAMFFIVIPLSGSIINEKNAGSFNRLKTLPVPISTTLSAKVIMYVIVCLIQFFLMIAVGLWLLPYWFGLPTFHPGNEYLAITLTTLGASLAAIGFGLIVGTCSSTHAQAALFGSVMVVILGIFSGTFLPIHMFPKAIQYLSMISPVRWGVDNYVILFVRQGTLSNVLPNILLLLLFFGFAMMISIVIFARQK